MRFIDLFAGAGGLSEGFVRAGFKPVAHVESDTAACNTLLTRVCYHYLKHSGQISEYISYTSNRGKSREEFYGLLPQDKRLSVINKIIGRDNKEIFKKIDKLKGSKKIDLIVGGPPCQAYSIAGRSRDANGMKGDRRNFLYEEYAKFLKRYKPKYFVFENVVGLLSARNEDGSLYLQNMLDLFKEIGYTTDYETVNARDFGVLQNRKRVILIGRRGKKDGFYPVFEKWIPKVNVSELFMDLPFLKPGEGDIYDVPLNDYCGTYLYESGIRNSLNFTTHHIARPQTVRDREIYKIAVKCWEKDKSRLNYNSLPAELKTHKNRTSHIDRFKVVAGDIDHAQTVVAHVHKDGHYYIHPDIEQNRSLTPREVARIQSFPDNYFFENKTPKPSRTPAFNQIGNAVPPLMAYGIAKSLKKTLKNEKNIRISNRKCRT